MAGCSPAAVICEIMKDDGTMARLPDLQLFAAEHGLKIGTIADLIEYRSRTESLVQKSVRGCCTPPLATSPPMPSKTSPARPCTWRWCAANGSPKRAERARARSRTLSVLDVLEVGRTMHSWSLDASLRLSPNKAKAWWCC